MTEPDEDRGQDWIERIVKIGAVFGFNEMRLRWKLLRWRDKRAAASQRAGQTMTHARYEHLVCSECGRIQPRGTKECSGCGASISPHVVQVAQRVAGFSGLDVSAGMLMGVLIVLCFVRQIQFSGGNVMSFDGLTLVRLGAHFPPLEWRGEWWRLGTAIFLHVGLMHAGFNLIALVQISPSIEEVFGRGRTLFLFMATGFLAFVPGMLLHRDVPVIGASGAIMGLIGVAAGWGQRDGTSIGRAVRNQMLTWLLYTTIFGFFVHADHSAHITGFVAGGLFGYFSKPVLGGRRSPRSDFALGTIAVVAALACVALIMITPDRNLGG